MAKDCQVDKTKVIRIFETFAGIGAQHKAIKNIKSNLFKVIKISEWDARAIVAYAQIHHHKNFANKLEEVKRWEISKIDKYLKQFTFSLNSKVPAKNILTRDENFKVNLVAANIVCKNLPDITKVNFENIKDCHLITYSFPCQGLSIANMGRDKGIAQGSNSTSSLLWEIKRILNEANEMGFQLPKYLVMENVENLLSKKHKPHFEEWKNYLKTLGYYTNTIVLNGCDYGSLQQRDRVFAISSIKKPKFEDDQQFKNDFERRFKSKETTIDKRKKRYLEILNSSSDNELSEAMLKDTASRQKMTRECNDLMEMRPEGYEWTFKTLTTKQDRFPNIGMVKLPEHLIKPGFAWKRLVTPREAYQIMGFTNEDYSRVYQKYQEKILTKESLYRQAGNSIVVEVIEKVFKYIESLEMEQDES